MDSLYEQKQLVRIAFELVESQLARQKEDLRNFRNQAAFCAAANGLIASVFSTLASKQDWDPTSAELFLGLPFSLWLVLIFITSSLAFAIKIITDYQPVIFDLSADWILAQVDEQKGYKETLARLAKDGSKYFDDNEKVIKGIQQRLLRALILAFAQIPAWIYHLA